MARPPRLEQQVLDILWRGGSWSVRDVLAEVDDDLAYTTIATVLDRLHGKREVKRAKEGGSWQYRAARSREAAAAAAVSRVLQRVEGAPEPLLVAFLDQVEQADPKALDRLAELIRARREQS